jgi:hypothetical protein
MRRNVVKLKTSCFLLLLTMISIPSWSADQGHGFKQLKQNGSLVYYFGRVVLEGEFSYSMSAEDREMIGDKVCFYPSKRDGKLIPRENGDHRMPWFCFKNTKQAKDLLGISELLKNPTLCKVSGKATVEIENYVVDKAETNTSDSADLVKVINRSDPTVKNFSKTGQECQ